MTKRRRFKQTVPFKERVAQWAEDVREQAAQLPPGADCDDLFQADTASHIEAWANCPELQPQTR